MLKIDEKRAIQRDQIRIVKPQNSLLIFFFLQIKRFFSIKLN
jgi:hypothetical protein